MSKLSEKFAAGKKALADRMADDVVTQSPPPSPFLRAAGPLHGSVSTMKLDMLKSENEALKAGKPLLKLDPKLIKASSWANRHHDSFGTDEFASLKSEIESAGGNVQPIKVRPIDETDGFKYEIVFGHRRHRACLELAVDVNAVVERLDEKQLFIQMDRENRQREDLSPYEQGAMYAKALDAGLFASMRKLAEDIGVDATGVSKAVTLARLPEPILDCFESRLDLQHRWASEIKEIWQREPDLVLARAKDIKKQRSAGNAISSKSAFELLVGKSPGDKAAPERTFEVGNRSLTITERRGKVSFELDRLNHDKLQRLEKYILDLMAD